VPGGEDLFLQGGGQLRVLAVLSDVRAQCRPERAAERFGHPPVKQQEVGAQVTGALDRSRGREGAGQGRIDFADMNSERRYRFVPAYSRSKLANLMFTLELDRRARAARIPLVSVAANPGIVATGLLRSRRDQWGRRPRLGELAVASVQRLFGQSSDEGCLTTLYAATAPELSGGEYVAPAGPGHRRGTPAVAPPPRQALDPDTARRLWETSVQLTGVGFTSLIPAGSPPAGTAVRPVTET
jgi:NAD(P)-dependent dehydrogenase (short-subunit alcohol dehydrogenase family)